MKVALSFDVEDLVHAAPFSRNGTAGHDLPSMEKQTGHILDLLGEGGVHATFFFVGETAARMPHLVRRAADEGHEIASHGCAHRVLWELAPEEFRDDLRRSRRILEELCGREVRGFRAPRWSLWRETAWAVDILVEEGFFRDSSLMPAGRTDCTTPHHLVGPRGGRILEYPTSIMPFGPLPYPFSGGVFFRGSPPAITLRAFELATRRSFPPMLYLHPWEIDEAGGREISAAWRRLPLDFRLFFSLRWGSTEAKLRKILARWPCGSIEEVLAGLLSGESRIPTRRAETLRGVRIRNRGLFRSHADGPELRRAQAREDD